MYKLFFVSIYLFCTYCCYCQDQSTIQREKLYLHTDKDVYLIGDTIWYRAYLIDALTQQPSVKSGIFYIDLQSPDTISIYKAALHLNYGMASGYIPLNMLEIKRGNYRIKAFTRWMQNFGDSLVFSKIIKIIEGENSSNIDYTPINVREEDKDIHIQDTFYLKDKLGKAMAFGNLNFKFLETYNNGIVKEINNTADRNGRIFLDIIIPKRDFVHRSGKLIINSADGSYLATQLIPLESSSIDVQFLPESGHLIAGKKNLIGIKSIGEDGYGFDIKGILEDNRGNKILDFITTYKGMGVFSFIPEKDKMYIAELESGEKIPLPNVESSGTAIHVEKDSGDSIHFTIINTPDLRGKEFTVECKAKDFVAFSAKVASDGNDIRYVVAKELFPTGVARFILQDNKGHILNERVFFVDNHATLHINIQSDKNVYAKRDSIPLDIKVTDANGQPVQGSFSLAVTDATQVYKDFAAKGNIVSYMELESDVRGYVETPGYYLSHPNAMDNLLLTQGFVHYDWDTSRFKYLPEKNFAVSGKVLNIINNGIKDARVSIYGGNSRIAIMKDTVADKNGRFCFSDFPLFDTLNFRVQARRKSNINVNIGVELDKPDWSKPEAIEQRNVYNGAIPPQTNAQQQMLVKNKEWKDSLRRILGKGELADIIVNAKMLPFSHNLNGPGNADQVITSNAIKPYYGKTLLDVLKATVKGLEFGWCKCDNGRNSANGYKIDNQPITLIIDGQTKKILMNRPTQVYRKEKGRMILAGYNFGEDLKELLNSYDASDIKSMEVMKQAAYTEKYINTYESFQVKNGKRETSCPPVYIEITSYEGNGLRQHISPAGVEMYAPIPFVNNKTFYAPRYTVKDSSATKYPDFRSTVFWEPNIVSDANGKANISADLKTIYDIEIEGMDLNGNIGKETYKIHIN